MVLLILANVGTTFSSSALNRLYFVELKDATTLRSIRYGAYNSCLYYNTSSSPQSCTPSLPAYSFDVNQFAALLGASPAKISTYTDLVASSKINSLFKSIAIILPTTVFAFMAFSCTLFLRKNRDSNRIPLIGSFASLLSFLVGAAGLALVLVVFLKGLPLLEHSVSGLSHHWGGAIYLYGFGVLCTLLTFICFLLSFFVKNVSQDVYTLNDDSSTAKANEAYQPEFSPEVINTPSGLFPTQQKVEPYGQEQKPHEPQSPVYHYTQTPQTMEAYPQPNQAYHSY
ncbi:hypothetical protein BY458DRAFT_589377 [Sporodiniella umbellata]|nr:hypothetical protein BY458DRAFT_589377 [Sporodiniella umbellata]